MQLKTLATGSNPGNCYILTNNKGEHLLLDMGITINEIKKGLNYDVEHLVGGVCSHTHKDHRKAVKDLQAMGIPVWQPYLDEKRKRQRTKIGSYKIECFDVPHSVPCRGFIIQTDDLKILYATDFEYIKYDFKNYGLNILLIEMNYQQKVMDKLDIDSHISHTVLGHSSDITTTEFILHNQKHLQNVILCHYSKSGNMNRPEALEELKGKLPEYIETQWAIPGETIQLGCPF